MAKRSRPRNFIHLIAASIAAWQFAATAQLDGTAMAMDSVPVPRPVMVYHSRGACNGVVLAQDLVLTAAHCIVNRDNFKITGFIDNTLYSLADVAAAELHPQYIAPTATVPKADLALLRLMKPLRTFGPALLITRPVALGDRVEVVGREPPIGSSETPTERTDRAVFLVAGVESYTLSLVEQLGRGEVRRLGAWCYGFSGAPVFAIRARIPQLAGILRGGDCNGYLVATPIAPFREWIAESAKRLGSSFGL